MWIGMYVTGSYHEQFEVIYRLEQMIEDEVMNYFEMLCRLEDMW
jgi:hypothetical protein